MLVAIKVLDLQKIGSSKSFKAECNALRNIRHRNLVSVLSYCSSIDSKGHEFKALIYEFMENGDLDSWLHPEKADQTTRLRSLDLSQRLNIATDVASALHYLHNQKKSFSIKLHDNDMHHHLHNQSVCTNLFYFYSYFVGGAQKGYAIINTELHNLNFCNKIPQYGMGVAASTLGDVYSYGILLLEMIIGRRPTDDMFTDGLDLYNYVNMAMPEQLSKIVDPVLIATGEENREMATGEEVNNGGRQMEGLAYN
ncbi:unnamed protein product [Coffea canephora]|uniref:DH200=94 genomic scaffold, scaffold_1709 n=1 Tax=Coffea canephora TaxID=49390 RepID=A0A068VJ89_COFCA|nr:unnamed protein product [Coffea canephora]